MVLVGVAAPTHFRRLVQGSQGRRSPGARAAAFAANPRSGWGGGCGAGRGAKEHPQAWDPVTKFLFNFPTLHLFVCVCVFLVGTFLGLGSKGSQSHYLLGPNSFLTHVFVLQEEPRPPGQRALWPARHGAPGTSRELHVGLPACCGAP